MVTAMVTHTTSAADRKFRAEFESCEFPPSEFNHEAHLRLAYVYLVEYEPEAAQNVMRQALLSYIKAHDVPPTKFHETLTRSWILAVKHFMNKSASASFEEFAAQSQPLLDSKVMLAHYSPETLYSEDARLSYVEPDLTAIPR
jgi:hypothetical protein